MDRARRDFPGNVQPLVDCLYESGCHQLRDPDDRALLVVEKRYEQREQSGHVLRAIFHQVDDESRYDLPDVDALVAREFEYCVEILVSKRGIIFQQNPQFVHLRAGSGVVDADF